MANLLGVHDGLLAQGAPHGLAGFLAYECQAADVARAKADGLQRHYGLDNNAVLFWAHHADVDVRHAEWARGAFDSLDCRPELFEPSVRASADAWWAFLDGARRGSASSPKRGQRALTLTWSSRPAPALHNRLGCARSQLYFRGEHDHVVFVVPGGVVKGPPQVTRRRVGSGVGPNTAAVGKSVFP